MKQSSEVENLSKKMKSGDSKKANFTNLRLFCGPRFD